MIETSLPGGSGTLCCCQGDWVMGRSRPLARSSASLGVLGIPASSGVGGASPGAY